MKAILSRLAAETLLICAFLEGMAQGATDEVRRFAFGTPTSVTRAGFTKVTVKDVFTPEKGYGFQSAEGLRAFDRGGSKIERPKDEYTASVYGAYRTTSDITCALVEGRSDNAFLVALPDGEYTVWLIAGDAEWDPPLFEVWANGQKKLDVRIPRARFVFMEPFQARATGGQLRIELKGPHGWILSGLVIGKEGPELAEVVAKLERDIFFLTDPELPKWKEVKYAAGESAAGVDGAGAGAGLRGVSRGLHGADRAGVRSGADGDRKAADRLRHAGRVRAGDVLHFRPEGIGQRRGGAVGFRRRRGPSQDRAGERERRRRPLLAAAGERLGRQRRIPRRARDDRAARGPRLPRCRRARSSNGG